MGRGGLPRAKIQWLLLVSVFITFASVHAASTATAKRPVPPDLSRSSNKQELTGIQAVPSGQFTENANAAAGSSLHRNSKSHGYYDLYQGYDKGFSDLIYWVPLIIIFGAGIIFLPVLGALFATLAAGTVGSAVSTTVAGRRRRRDAPSFDAVLSVLSSLEKAIEKFRSL
ncbi:uncharacterized protein LOC144167040 [Haemaphysalis longicornis]